MKYDKQHGEGLASQLLGLLLVVGTFGGILFIAFKIADLVNWWLGN